MHSPVDVGVSTLGRFQKLSFPHSADQPAGWSAEANNRNEAETFPKSQKYPGIVSRWIARPADVISNAVAGTDRQYPIQILKEL